MNLDKVEPLIWTGRSTISTEFNDKIYIYSLLPYVPKYKML